MKKDTKTEQPLSYWDRLTDEELLRISFTTDDPENLEGLVQEIPRIQERPFVEFAYDFRGSKRPLIRCAHCRYPNHRGGFVIKSESGARFLCGHQCGDKIYGANFGHLHKDFSHARDRAGYLHRVQRLRQALPGFIRYLAELKADPAFSLFLQTRQDLIKGMPRLRGALQIAIDRHAGALTIEERARDFTAEERDEERYERDMEDWLKETVTERKRQRRLGMEPEKPRKPLYTSVSRSIGTISTKTLFAATASPKQFLEDIAAQFENLAHDPVSQMSKEEKSHFFGFRGKHDAQGSGWRVLVGFGDPSNKGMANLLKQVSILLDRLEEQIDRLAELPALFQPATLSALAAWATANKLAGTYKAGLGTLAFEPDHGKVVEIRMPAAFKVPDKAGIEIVRAALR